MGSIFNLGGMAIPYGNFNFQNNASFQNGSNLGLPQLLGNIGNLGGNLSGNQLPESIGNLGSIFQGNNSFGMGSNLGFGMPSSSFGGFGGMFPGNFGGMMPGGFGGRMPGMMGMQNSQLHTDMKTLKTDLTNDGINLRTVLDTARQANNGMPLSPTQLTTTVDSAITGLTTTQQATINADLQKLQTDASGVNTTTGTTASTLTPVSAFGVTGLSAPTAQAATDLQGLDTTLQGDGINLGTLLSTAFTAAANTLTSTQQAALTTQLTTLKNDGITLPWTV